MNLRKWFDLWWYRYLFAPLSMMSSGWLSTLWCRLRNHPCGSTYFNPIGLEPDNHCKNCGDEL